MDLCDSFIGMVLLKMTNRDIKYYMTQEYSIKITPDTELGFFTEIPDLPGCFGDGRTVDDAIASLRESQEYWLENALEKGHEIPLPRNENDYSGQFLLRMPKSLHKAIAEEALWEGVSMNQYLNTLITENRHVRAVHKAQELMRLGKGRTHTLIYFPSAEPEFEVKSERNKSSLERSAKPAA